MSAAIVTMTMDITTTEVAARARNASDEGSF
jgi:hypothetical protein